MIAIVHLAITAFPAKGGFTMNERHRRIAASRIKGARTNGERRRQRKLAIATDPVIVSLIAHQVDDRPILNEGSTEPGGAPRIPKSQLFISFRETRYSERWKGWN